MSKRATEEIGPSNRCMNCGEGFTPSHPTFRGYYCPDCAEHWNENKSHRQPNNE